MHRRLEVLMPPTDDVETALEKILKDFSENNEDTQNSFYDYFVLGGRWSGSHNLDGLEQELLDKFYAELKAAKVTISGLQFGKQTLQPSSQIPFVEETWSKYFPGSCPIFDHYTGGGDIITWAEAKTKDIKASRFIVANDEHEPKYMTQDSVWNGVSWIYCKWDGTIKSAFADYEARLKGYKPEYAAKITPTDQWLLVTVDYHS